MSTKIRSSGGAHHSPAGDLMTAACERDRMQHQSLGLSTTYLIAYLYLCRLWLGVRCMRHSAYPHALSYDITADAIFASTAKQGMFHGKIGCDFALPG